MRKELSFRGGRIEALDVARGLAASIVVFHHVFSMWEEEFASRLSSVGYGICSFISELNLLAVLFFFVLSGFAIGLSVDSDAEAQDWQRYAARRSKRILPVYWLALALSAGVQVVFHQPVSVFDLMGNLLFLQTPATGEEWVAPFAGNGPLWSISFEVWFYAGLPVLFWVRRKFSLRLIHLFWFSILAALAGLAANQIQFIPVALFAAYWPIWVVGMVLAAALRARKKSDFHRLFASLIVVLIALQGIDFFIHSATIHGLKLGLFIGCVFALAIYFVGLFEFKRFYTVPGVLVPLKKLGDGSYALYALHMPFLLIFQFLDFPLWLTLSCVMGLTAPCYFIEQGLIRALRKL